MEALVLLGLKLIWFNPAMLIRTPQLPRWKVSAQPLPRLCTTKGRLFLLQYWTYSESVSISRPTSFGPERTVVATSLSEATLTTKAGSGAPYRLHRGALIVVLLTELPGDNLLPSWLTKTPYSGHVAVVCAKGGSSRDSTICTNAKVNMLADGIGDIITNRKKENK